MYPQRVKSLCPMLWMDRFCRLREASFKFGSGDMDTMLNTDCGLKLMDLEVKDGFGRQYMGAHAHKVRLAPLVDRSRGEKARGQLVSPNEMCEHYDGFEQDEVRAEDGIEDAAEHQ
jgi:hypothetical protein